MAEYAIKVFLRLLVLNGVVVNYGVIESLGKVDSRVDLVEKTAEQLIEQAILRIAFGSS